MSETNEVEERNGTTVSESSASGSAAADEIALIHVDPTDGSGEEVPVFVDSPMNDSSGNQEEHADQSNGESINAGDSTQVAPNDARVTEEGMKEDMFVDCPDEIENSETPLTLEGEDNQQDTEVKELDNGFQDNDLISEIKNLRHALENTAAERDSFAKKYEEEREAFKELHANSCMKDQEIEKFQHVEEFANRILASLAASVYQEDIVDGSITGKIYYVENAISFVLEKYNLFCSGIEQLKWSLAEVAPGITMQDEVGIFSSVCNNIFELRSKVGELDQKLVRAEDENKQLMEHIEKHKVMVENANAELSKLHAELEQEKTRYANTKEKLSMAVTKGKALVQQRDSLKQSLADKASELEKCLMELKDKSSAIEAAEQSKNLLVQSESLVASLQGVLTEKDMLLQKCTDILFESAGTEEHQSMDIIEKVRWLTEEKNALKRISLEFHKLVDALSAFDFPETLKSDGLDAQISWLLESVNVAKEEVVKLQDEISRTKEAANDDIGRLSASLLVETQEKDYLRAELEDLTSKYKLIAAKEYQGSVEKDRIINMLQEASGVANGDQERDAVPSTEVALIVNKCIAKIKEDISASFQFSDRTVESFEKMQNLLYISNVTLNLHCQCFEEEIIDKADMSSLSNELLMLRNELSLLKDEKDSLQKDLERSEEKAAMLREKLSMAVKKGKGLVQDRENLKKALEEKNTEIENLKAELQEQVTACSDCRDQINKLLVDLERIPQLEGDVRTIEDQRNQVEKFLAESNSMLQRVLESIDDVIVPGDTAFDDPVEKVKWLAGYLSECQSAKVLADQAWEKAKEEASDLTNKLEEVQITMKSLQDALSDAESKIMELDEEKRELVVSKTNVEQELKKVIEESSSQTNKFVEVCAIQKSLEDALQAAESNITLLTNEKETALASRAAAETELHKVKEEISSHTIKLLEADKIIQSLEDALSQAKENLSLLEEENMKAKIGKTDLENEIKKLKEEVDSHVARSGDANSTMKLLEESLSNAEGKIRDLENDKNNAEEEISSLNVKLNACMQELAGTHGNLENRSVELSGHLTSLRRHLKDETLASSLCQSFEKKIGDLNAMNLLLKEIRDAMVAMDLDMQQIDSAMEDESSLPTIPSSSLDYVADVGISNGEENSSDADGIVFHIGETVEGLQSRDRLLADKVEGFSAFMDYLNASLLEKLRVTKTTLINMPELIDSLKQKVNETESDRQALKNTLIILEDCEKSLLPACSEATEELKLEVKHCLTEFKSNSELWRLNDSLSMDLGAVDIDSVEEDQLELDSNKYVKAAQELLFAARQSRNLSRHFQNVMIKMITTIEYLHNEMKESKRTSGKVLEERDQSQEKVSKLENDIETLENICKDMRLRLNEYEERENNLKEREAEFLSLSANSSKKLEEAEDSLLSASQLKSLFDKVNGIDVAPSDWEAGDVQSHDPADVQKLFYILEAFAGLKHQIGSLSELKEKLQSTVEKQVFENKHLKAEVEEYYSYKNEQEKMKNELSALAISVENIIQKLGGDELVESKKEVVGLTGLLQELEIHVLACKKESNSSNLKAEELSAKLLETQKVVDDLSSKIKLLEDSNQAQVIGPETIRERGAFESSSPTQSEISEIQDMEPVSKNITTPAIPPVQSAAHPRTLRKGSSDHLSISIDPDSERLLKKEKDEDKGHVFKSLNTSGLIPRQGKIIADRVDGMWVSGSRALMNHPRARLGLITYWLFVHLWLLGTIL